MPGPAPPQTFNLTPDAPRAEAEEVTVEGVVQRVVFTSTDGNFAVLRLEVSGQPQPIIVIGSLGQCGEGEMLRVVGRYETHPQYGRRLRATQAVPRIPQTAGGVERYLATLTGLGPESARRLVASFGTKAIEVLEAETWKAGQVKGIGKRRATRAAADARARREEREVMVFLQGHGVSAAYANRIRRTYGDAAMVRVRENPYRLARDVPGIGFQIADRIAHNMGIDHASPLRVEAGLIYTLDSASDAGHCFLPQDELCLKASDELRLESPPPPVVLAPDAGPPGTQAQLLPPPPRPPNPDTAGAGPMSLVRDALHSLGLQQALILEAGDAFLPRLHRAEVALCRRLAELRAAERPPVPTLSHAPVRGAKPPPGAPVLSDGQRRALQMIEESPLCVITGGPGTGKTTIIRTLVRAWEADSRRVLLVAPTGRAAKRLSEATGRPASTVHRLLEWAPAEGFRRRPDRLLEADLLVCDEASMLDLPLARALCGAVPPGATLLLVGDVDQLPSVGPGRVLADLIDSGIAPVARLNEIFRQAEGSGIVHNAHRILRGEMPISAPRGELAGDFYFIEAEEPLQARELVVRLVTERIPQRFGLDPIRDVQVLTPMHRGEAGTEELNRALQAALNPAAATTPELKSRGRSFRLNDKVMQIRNDYDRDVWNGDVGIVNAVQADDGAMRVQFDDRDVECDTDDLDQLELAYAMSVHKSQGSEYPAVVLPLLMQHYVMLRRNLLYTAVTRGKRLVVIVGSRRALGRAAAEQGDLLRYTRLKERLRGDLPA